MKTWTKRDTHREEGREARRERARVRKDRVESQLLVVALRSPKHMLYPWKTKKRRKKSKTDKNEEGFILSCPDHGPAF